MAMRVLSIAIPQKPCPDEVRELLGENDATVIWEDESRDERTLIQVILPAENSEPVTDALEEKYGKQDGFHIIVQAVEAVLPRPAEVADPEAATQAEDESEHDAKADNQRISREELYNDVTDALGVDRVFIAMTLLSSFVAAVGLLRDDVAVIIGAMVIAPLLGPNVAMALAATLGDVKLLRCALRTNLTGVSVTLLVAISIGFLVTVDPSTPAIASRSRVDFSNVIVALSAGAAGTLAFTRGLASTVVGVMVAVALMPPAVAVGLLVGGGHFGPAAGAFLLFLANIVCINLAGIGTFLAQGVRARTWWEAERARRSMRIALAVWTALLLALVLVIYLAFSRETGR